MVPLVKNRKASRSREFQGEAPPGTLRALGALLSLSTVCGGVSLRQGDYRIASPLKQNSHQNAVIFL